ncbi:MAG: RNA-binding protein [Symploca sp. SIO1A3]|nr:RNA-binding protein [Symploca sp. SIO2C1]NER53073.1 RNA-binding protein [Symploca sp. SIO1A3]
MSIRLYVGNLPKEQVNRDELHALFAEMDQSITTKVIKERKTGKCRGFAFVTVPTDEMAEQIIEKFNGHTFKDVALKIEKAQPKAKTQDDESKASGSGSNNSSGRRGGGKKPPKRSSSNTTSSNSGQIQPDPRWAEQLAILKERLSAQSTNS